MKVFMLIVNALLMVVSGLGLGYHLICGQFGIAWLCVIPLIYTYLNYYALWKEE